MTTAQTGGALAYVDMAPSRQTVDPFGDKLDELAIHVAGLLVLLEQRRALTRKHGMIQGFDAFEGGIGPPGKPTG
ncbi:MAG: hypothetical protein JSU86_05755 [Phycisphaerales bacterium]|nr:MAG: hypothetical protein JSU86_05755 [Phycisphaerales bacterium]